MRIFFSVLLVAVFTACAQNEQSDVPTTGTAAEAPHTSTARIEEGGPATAEEGTQTIHVGSDFSPTSIIAKAGEPIRLAFHRTDEPSCGDEVVFPDLGIRKSIPPNATTIVELPAQQSARTLQFTCGMDMMKGQLIVQ